MKKFLITAGVLMVGVLVLVVIAFVYLQTILAAKEKNVGTLPLTTVESTTTTLTD